jgi:eukaryotic-like serine/threonine-protein kinase
MARANELQPGVEIDGTYRIVEKLGEGGMGAVYVAELVRLPKRVALKVLHVAADEGAKARFRREAEIAAKVHHPRIVEVLDYNFLEDGSPYLVMELLEGNDLRHRLASGPLTPGEALPILRDVASALERLHAEGIVHRDLKPENVFLAEEGDEVRAKVLDFGISKIVGGATSLTAEQSVLGTPAYMAPEQVTGENAALDARTDQFALAAVAFEMLTGRPAFKGEHVMQLFHQILTAPTPALSAEGTPSAADAVFARALSKERADRYLSVSAFVLALSEAFGVELARASAVDTLGARMVAPAITAVTSSSAVPVASARRGVTFVALAGIVAAAIAAWALWPEAPGHMAEGVSGAREEAVSIPEIAADVTDDAPAQEDDAPVAATDPPAEPVAEPEPVEPPAHESRDAPPRTSMSKTTRPSDADALARLTQAEAALAAGDAQEAIRLARVSLGKEPSDAARVVLTKAACDRRDLGLAKAMSRGLRGASLRDAKQYCERSGIQI